MAGIKMLLFENSLNVDILCLIYCDEKSKCLNP